MNSSWLDRYRHIIFVVLLLIAAAGAGVFYLRQPAPEPIEVLPTAAPAARETPAPSPTPSPIRVYVSGAVVNSDVYFLPQGSIVKDAVLAAGGFSADADRERINQALELKDQQQIHVPRVGEDAVLPVIQGGADEQGGQPGTISSDTTGLVNINTATVEQLDGLPGIGPAIAQRIIEYRENIGGFKGIDQITEVKGIGPAAFAEIKDLITIE